MNRLLQRFDAWFHAPAPAERLALLRIGIGGYALVYLVSRIGDLLAPVKYPASSFSPVGVVQLLSSPLPAFALYSLYAASVLTGALFVAGVLYRWVAPLFAVLLLWMLSYRHAWGMIFHTDNLPALHVLLLACAPAADVYRFPPRTAPARKEALSGWVVRAICLVTVASYLVAGVAKLNSQGWHWIAGEALREQIAYDALRKIELGSTHSPLGPWLLPHAALFPALSVFALAAELLAPLALVGGLFAVVWCTAAWLFHLGVLGTMAIVFPYPISGCAFLAFFPLERGWSGLVRRFPRLRSRARGPTP